MESFWNFSVRVYGLPGVREACLGLQDGRGADVNLVLFALWAGVSGRALGVAEFQAVERAVGGWRREVVAPLRGVRRALRGWAGDEAAGLRAAVGSAELAAERRQQGMMEALLPSPGGAGGAGSAAANLAAYAEAAGLVLDVAAVEVLVAASRTCRGFPG